MKYNSHMGHRRVTIVAFCLVAITCGGAAGQETARPSNPQWIPAADESSVQRIGLWREDRFRYAAAAHLTTQAVAAALECKFRGTGIILRLSDHAVPAYGVPNHGSLAITVDGEQRPTIVPLTAPKEIVIARDLADEHHIVRVQHQAGPSGRGCRIEGFFVLHQPTAELRFVLGGEDNAFLVDARAIVRKGDRVIRNALVRNWLTGQCSLAGLPPGDGYTLEVTAVGWQPATVEDLTLRAGTATETTAIFLHRDSATRIAQVRFPALNRPAIRKSGEAFRARILAYKSPVSDVRLTRRVGPAVVSRRLSFKEDPVVAYYYDREVVANLPADMPAGIYDLQVTATNDQGRTRTFYSPHSVHLVQEFPRDPVLVTFGHLDTSGQYQAEYLERLVSMINLIAPDVVLNSTAVNPAYISGALSKLDMPYIVNFGNHQFYGHEKWFGDPVGMVDFGPDMCILNFGHPWHADHSKAESLLASRPNCRHKIINAFESNAPIDWLDQHRVCMIHDAHGIGEKVMDIGSTPTLRVGKVNATSFRVVRFSDGRVASCTYNKHDTAPIPFGRDETPPLRVQFSSPNDGTSPSLTATVTNEYLDEFPNCRLQFVLPKGNYIAEGGRVESAVVSDDGKFTVLSVRTNVPAQRTVSVHVRIN
ncbi:MAG TPA: carboxypeptidase regulatory-like domain-containing protein [Planctomycetaceae bacterium]|nr:carboxypeptidase regulatory-like domain-containing protein [Planctomycetaceae bacterium]